MDLSFQIETQISKIFSRKNEESQGLMGFKEFVTEDSDAVISQIRQIRDHKKSSIPKMDVVSIPRSVLLITLLPSPLLLSVEIAE